jgi:cytochrome c2
MKSLGLITLSVLALAAVNPARAMDAPPIYAKKCELCHSIGGVGGKKKDTGGKLDGVGSKRDEAWLRAYFKDPKSKVEKAKMPKVALSDEEWNSLVQYMLSLK